MARVELINWRGPWEDLRTRVSRRFARPETRQRLEPVLLALLGDLPRKNCWTLAEHAGEVTPHGVQHLLARAVWDTDGVTTDLRSFVADHLGHPDGILVVDETGDLKKGTHSVGVQRQSPPPCGREVPPPAPPGASRTPRSPSTWLTRPAAGTR